MLEKVRGPHFGQINEIHHSKHHATYAKGVDTAIEQLAEARAKDDHAAGGMCARMRVGPS